MDHVDAGVELRGLIQRPTAQHERLIDRGSGNRLIDLHP